MPVEAMIATGIPVLLVIIALALVWRGTKDKE